MGTPFFCKSDRWIPKSIPNYPQIKTDANPSICLASQLVDNGSLSWHICKLKEVFEEEEAKNIMSIPLSMFRDDDNLVWHFSNSGSYSIKSEYWVACEMKERSLSSNQAGPSPMTIAANRAMWKQIWRLQLPPKLAVFLWRLLQDKLPTNTKLKNNYSSC